MSIFDKTNDVSTIDAFKNVWLARPTSECTMLASNINKDTARIQSTGLSHATHQCSVMDWQCWNTGHMCPGRSAAVSHAGLTVTHLAWTSWKPRTHTNTYVHHTMAGSQEHTQNRVVTVLWCWQKHFFVRIMMRQHDLLRFNVHSQAGKSHLNQKHDSKLRRKCDKVIHRVHEIILAGEKVYDECRTTITKIGIFKEVWVSLAQNFR